MSSHNMIYHIAMLLDKMTSPDKDYRFMATNDLITELQRETLKLDDDTEKKIVLMAIRLLDDKNGEVQNLAVKLLGPLTQRVNVAQFEYILDVLCEKLLSTNQNLQSRERDVTSIALKTVMAGIPVTNTQVSSAAIKKVMPTINLALSGDPKTANVDPSVKLELLDIVGDLLNRFGNMMCSEMNFPLLQSVLFKQVCSDRLTLRKRAITALSALTAACDQELSQKVMSNLVVHMRNETRNVALIRTYTLLAASFASSAPGRFSEYLGQVVPLILNICNAHEDEELKEACVGAFETFVYEFPKDIERFLPDIIAVVKETIRFDPNFNDDDDDEEEQMETDGDSDGSDIDDYSDDEDMSWKVRRASAKCIQALLVTRRSEIVQSIKELGAVLISRMKEREENVKIDVFQSYVSLLKEIKTAVPNVWRRGLEASNENVIMVGDVAFPESSLTADHAEVLSALCAQIPLLMKALGRQLKSRSVKTRQQCFILLTNLLRAYPNCLVEYFGVVISATESSLNDKTMEGNLKISLLEFVEALVTLHNASAFVTYARSVVPLVTKSVDESFYKVTSAGLQVLHVMLMALRPDANQPSILDDEAVLNNILAEMYRSVGQKLKANDIDQEVKEQAIECAGTLLALFGDNRAVDVDEYLAVFVDRLKNEMTRLAAVKALTTIVNSPLKLNMSRILSETLGLCAEFLRKNIRTLKLATLQLLCAMVTRFSKGGLEGEALVRVTSEVPVLVNETDLQISQLALRFISEVIPAYPDQISMTLSPLFKSFILLTKSPLLQGKTLKSALRLLEVLVKSPLANKPCYEGMLSQLSKAVYDQPCELPKQAFMSIAKCCAVVCKYSNELAKTVELTAKFAQQLEGGADNENVRLFSLLCLGEIGRIYTEVFDEGVARVRPMEFIANVYDTHSDEVKSHASLALGAVAAGNLTRFLPFLLNNIINQPKRQYLLLHALSEVIASENINEHYAELFRPHINDVWKVLMDYRGHQKEGSRNVISKCLGKLAMIDPEFLLPELEECLQSQDSYVRSTAVTAVRFALADRDHPIDVFLKPVIDKFLRLINDPDVHTRRLSLVTFNAAVHNKIFMIRPLLGELLPLLYSETVVKKELIREVEMGPFKHAVDDGLDIRKAAFECLYTLLENGLDQVDVGEFISRLEDGIQDHHDIKLISYLMVSRLCQLCPHQVSQRAERIATLIKTQVSAKSKQNAVKQETDKFEEARRAGLRTLVSLLKLSNECERCQAVIDVVTFVRNNNDLVKLFESVQREEKLRPTCPDMVYLMETD